MEAVLPLQLGGSGAEIQTARLISSSRSKENSIAFCSIQPQSLPVSIHRCVYSACAKSWLMQQILKKVLQVILTLWVHTTQFKLVKVKCLVKWWYS